MIRSLIITLLMLSSCSMFAQKGNDTIITLPVANIFDSRVFLPEEAGMKTTHVDSVIMMEKISQDLSDLLSENTHVFIKSYGRGALSTAAFRGTAPSHTQVYWNGININSPMLGMVDFSLIPVYILDDVSLNHGSSSVADGNGGLGGSINLDNSAQWDEGFDLKFLQGIGFYSSYEDFLSLKFGKDRFHSKTRFYYSSSQNDYTFLNRNVYDRDPVTGEFIYIIDTNNNAEYMKYGVLQEFYYRERSGAVWSLRYWGQQSGRSIPEVASYEGPEMERLNKLSDDDHKIVLNRTYASSKQTFTLQTGYQNHFINYFLKNFIPGYGYQDMINSDSRNCSFFNKVEYKRTLDKGWSFNSSLSYDYHDVSTIDAETLEGYENDRNDISLFVSLRKQFFGRLNTNLMVRQGYIDDGFTPIAPFIGFDFLMNPRYNIIFKGNVARNFHQPTLNDLYWMPGGNPDLRPEDGVSIDFGAEMMYEKGKFKVIPDFSCYYSDMKDWIIWLPTRFGYWEPRNIKRVVSKGVEASLNVSWMVGEWSLKSIVTYSYTSALNYGEKSAWGDDSYGKQLPFIPIHSGNVMFSAGWKSWSVVWQNNTYSRRYTTSSNDITYRGSVYPYYMNDLKVGREFMFKSFDLAAELKISNLFNETYHSVLLQPMPGINGMLQLMFDLK